MTDISYSSSDSSERISDEDKNLQVYQRKKWLKATFNKETKRFCEVELSMPIIYDALVKSFPVLKIILEQKSRPQTIQLYWKEKVIETSADLHSAYRHCNINNQVLHLIVTTRDCTQHDIDSKNTPSDYANLRKIAKRRNYFEAPVR